MEEEIEIKNSNVSDEPVLLNTPLSDKVAQEDNNDEIDAFLAIEVSSNFEEGYFDSEGDVSFLDNLLSDDASHNLASEVISNHEPEQNESSITFSPRSDPRHHEFADFNSQSQENVHANQSSVIESLPISPIPVEDSEPAQEEIDIFFVLDDLIPSVRMRFRKMKIMSYQSCHQDDRQFSSSIGTTGCTDISKITRKSSKNGQTRTRRTDTSTKKPKIQKQKPEKSQLISQLSQRKEVYTKNVQSRIWHTGNPCEIEFSKAQDDSQMIDGMIGQDSKERVQQGTA
ncbi:hypothetical protein Tco_0623188 [Tanacetum coccineum]